MMAAYTLPRPKIVKGWVESQRYLFDPGSIGRSRAGVRAETDEAG
jgi:hypothetical protein